MPRLSAEILTTTSTRSLYLMSLIPVLTCEGSNAVTWPNRTVPGMKMQLRVTQP